MLVEVVRRRMGHAYRYQYARLIARPQVPVDIDDPGAGERDATAQEMANMGIHLMGRDVDPENGTAFDTDGTPIVRVGRYVSPGDSGEIIVREDDMTGEVQRERVEPDLLAPPPGLEGIVEPIAWGGSHSRLRALNPRRKMLIHRAEVIRAVRGDAIRDLIRPVLGDRVDDDRPRTREGRKEPERRQDVLAEARRVLAEARAAADPGDTSEPVFHPDVVLLHVGMIETLDKDLVTDDLIPAETPMWEPAE